MLESRRGSRRGEAVREVAESLATPRLELLVYEGELRADRLHGTRYRQRVATTEVRVPPQSAAP